MIYAWFSTGIVNREFYKIYNNIAGAVRIHACEDRYFRLVGIYPYRQISVVEAGRSDALA